MIIIIGGGLSGSLLAYKLSLMENAPDFLLIESNQTLCGNQTWSFHSSDIDFNTAAWINPLISKSWTAQEVKFHNFERTLENGYHAITSESFADKIQKKIGNRLLLGKRVQSINEFGITLEDGKQIESKIIFDGRGMDSNNSIACGYQKFLGMDLELEEPHNLVQPIIMDAACEQKEGYRFFYLLPWTSTSLLIEDTRYSNSPDINPSNFENEIKEYCRKKGWKIREIIRTESAALPIPLNSESLRIENDSLISIGVRGGYFHATTGYSLPYAVQIAEIISSEIGQNSEWSFNSIQERINPLKKSIQNQSQFFTLLNRMLFFAGKPENRWKIFLKFYRFKSDLIARFYKGELRKMDKFKILTGKPPVPVFSAIQQAFAQGRK